jgi:prevent-host-death family protein
VGRAKVNIPVDKIAAFCQTNHIRTLVLFGSVLRDDFRPDSDVKARLSKYLRQVKAGRGIVIAERGKAVGRLVPNAQSLEEKLLTMVKSGRAEWNGIP